MITRPLLMLHGIFLPRLSSPLHSRRLRYNPDGGFGNGDSRRVPTHPVQEWEFLARRLHPSGDYLGLGLK